MDKIEIKEIDLKRFDALARYSRSPTAAYISEEIAWYANSDESLLGVLLLDRIDNDFVGIVIARDKGGRYRAFDVHPSMATVEEAKNWLLETMKWHTVQTVKTQSENDPAGHPNLFKPVTNSERLAPDFVLMSRDSAFVPARAIINKMMPYYSDIDGNFVEQFQTTGFDARLWELYLYAYLIEEELYIERPKPAPDFIVTKYGKSVAIEATIVGRRADNPRSYFKGMPKERSTEEILHLHKNEMPIRFGSPLFSKLQKRYWENPHIAGLPLVLAIADFHDDQSMLWSGTALINYLYGVKHEFHYNENGQLIINPVRLEKHVKGEKVIPSGYFFQPDAENISAVLFSASGTVSKFNRIGRQAGFYDPQLVMIREGTCHNHDPNASLPHFFIYTVDETCNETWGEGLSMFHNPNAQHPVPPELFPSVAHHRFENGLIVSVLPDFHPYASITLNLRLKDKDT